MTHLFILVFWGRLFFLSLNRWFFGNSILRRMSISPTLILVCEYTVNSPATFIVTSLVSLGGINNFPARNFIHGRSCVPPDYCIKIVCVCMCARALYSIFYLIIDYEKISGLILFPCLSVWKGISNIGCHLSEHTVHTQKKKMYTAGKENLSFLVLSIAITLFTVVRYFLDRWH